MVFVLRKHSTLDLAEGEPCPYCGFEMSQWGLRRPSRDHIVPKFKGGKLDPDNKIIVCLPCNEDKGCKSIEAWASRLAKAGDPRAAIVQSLIEKRRADKLKPKPTPEPKSPVAPLPENWRDRLKPQPPLIWRDGAWLLRTPAE